MKLQNFRLSLATLATVAVFATVVHAANPVPPYTRSGQEQVTRTAPVRSSLNRFQLRNMNEPRVFSRFAGTDTIRVLAVRVDFTDSTIVAGRDDEFFTNELRHLSEYFDGASRGRTCVAADLLPTVYQLPRAMGYYGADQVEEVRVVELIEDTIALSDDDVDFSQYDHLFVIHAGAGQETDLAGDSRNQLWSSFYDRDDIAQAFPDTTITGLPTSDGVEIDNFSLVPAVGTQDNSVVGTLGIWAFELASRLGLLPLFDSSPGIPDSQGVGNFCVMAYGIFNAQGFVPAYPCAYNRVIAGWVDPVTIDPSGTTQSVRVADINSGADNDTLCVKIPISENEYFLVVNRVHDTNFDSLFTFTDIDTNLIPQSADTLRGAEFDFFLTDLTNPFVQVPDPRFGSLLKRHTGSGLYVWHVDETVIAQSNALEFLPNDFVGRKGVDLEEADGSQDLDRGGLGAFALGSFYDSFRNLDGAATSFGPGSRPNSQSNAGGRTGIMIDNVSAPGPVMTMDISRAAAFTDTRRRWDASGHMQAPTVTNLNGGATSEILTLGDDAGLFAFNADASELVDGDADPSTTAPWIPVAGEVWSGDLSVGNIDGGSDLEIVAASTGGRLYAWKSDGTEVADGDSNPGTTGVLFAGTQLLAPPTVANLVGDANEEIIVVDAVAGNVVVDIIDATGAIASGPVLTPHLPFTVAGNLASGVSVAQAEFGQTASMGLVFATVDTTSRIYQLHFVPVAVPTPGPQPVLLAQRTLPTSIASMPNLLAPAVADLDNDGNDDVVWVDPVGDRVQIANGSDRLEFQMREGRASNVAIGDIDSDGILELALWDDSNLYVLASNARLKPNWPLPIRPGVVAEQPPTSFPMVGASPLIFDVDGRGGADILFPVGEGAVFAVNGSGEVLAGFPRSIPSGALATASAADVTGNGALELITLGSIAAINAVNTITDQLDTTPRFALSVQSMAATDVNGPSYWVAHRSNSARTGRVVVAARPVTSAPAVDETTFMVYPNPATGATVNARVILSQAATVIVEIFNLEGERAFEATFNTNPGGATNTPFDESIDVSTLASGVYFMRLEVKGDRGSRTLTKPFAIRR